MLRVVESVHARQLHQIFENLNPSFLRGHIVARLGWNNADRRDSRGQLNDGWKSRWADGGGVGRIRRWCC